MSLKNDGFFFAEILLSLSAWLLATSILLPLTMLLLGQSVQVRQEADAIHLLYDQLQQLKFNPEHMTGDSVEVVGGTVYTITMNRQDSDSIVEVCVEFEGFFQNEKSRKCGLVE
ncbi:hypothetical protein [Bacillus sp. B15-48]|uniref:hypothetical protein n=1 Tax=Bacillus sp. B15-48 TaxID=1548601 RepID=UPI00193FA089|nr:hypothetical protein [Bacillus sp. B15-48]MBM4762275.1 hypothetical protein [Bacillus sp. B15-48]